ncbi:hypothetical protein DRO19_02515 [Candidatus Bathyarchaeota archaeon]|nr:MAG: hypothetical protein DRO19_02515 [Candidatus Bathyarchaeota archaeon]
MSKIIKKFLEGEPKGEQGFRQAAMYGFAFSAPKLHLELTKEEKKKAEAWLLEQLNRAPATKTERLFAETLICLINKRPWHEMPLFHEFIRREREKKKRSLERKRKRDLWLQFKDKGHFYADNYKVKLCADTPEATVQILEPFKVEVSVGQQRRIINLGDIDVEEWKNKILGRAQEVSAQYGSKPKRLTIPLNEQITFVKPLNFREISREGLQDATIRDGLEKTVSLVLVAEER